VNPSLTNIIDDLRLLQEPRPWTFWAWIVLGAVMAVLIACWVWRKLRQPTRPLSPAEVAEVREDALAELARLRNLIGQVHCRQYAVEVSGVVRRYIERRFGLRAPRRSTEEFLVEAQASAKLDQLQRERLAEFLGSCDFLKFARAIAERPELETIHESAVRFVTDTQPVATAAPATTGGNP
jgi:hypothetical protein